MRALSIKQPWADAIVHHDKDIENRTWKTSHRGPFLIHAGKTFDESVIGWIEGTNMDLDLHDHIKEVFADDFLDRDSLVTGAILGVANLVDCVTESDSVWFQGPYGFMLKNVKPFSKPIPCKGSLRFFDPPEDVLWKVYEEMGGK